MPSLHSQTKKSDMRFALFGNTYQAKKSSHAEQMFRLLERHHAQLCINREFYHFLANDVHLKMPHVELFDDNRFQADMVISLGGDGTFLKAASHVGRKGIPILGINTGRLGFLADISPEEMEDTFNEIAVLKRDSSSMISIRATVNNSLLTTYQADGLIVATPTGSTAYSLSVGGPIIAPDSKTIALTPVAPHSLNMRPIVICDDREITLEVESRSHNFLVAIDGRSESCRENTRLVISKADYTIKVVKRFDHRFFDTLRHKMMWGADIR